MSSRVANPHAQLPVSHTRRLANTLACRLTIIATLALCSTGVWLTSAALSAQSLPGFVEVAPAIEGDRVLATAVGASLASDGPLAASRLAARRRGEESARQLIHRWADDALASSQATPAQAQATHAAINRASVVTRTRPRADGSATVEVACPLRALRTAFDSPRAPWHGARP